MYILKTFQKRKMKMVENKIIVRKKEKEKKKNKLIS